MLMSNLTRRFSIREIRTSFCPCCAPVVALIFAIVGIFLAPVPSGSQRGGPPPPIALDKVSMPPGFQIEIYAEGLQAARQMALADDGTVFVGSFGLFTGAPDVGNIYAVRDSDRDGRADEVMTVLSGLTVPNGVAFRDGALFVAAPQTNGGTSSLESMPEGGPELPQDSVPADFESEEN